MVFNGRILYIPRDRSAEEDYSAVSDPFPIQRGFTGNESLSRNSEIIVSIESRMEDLMKFLVSEKLIHLIRKTSSILVNLVCHT